MSADLPPEVRMLDAAMQRRNTLLRDPRGAVRLFNGSADGIEGFVLEKFGPVLIAQLHEQRLALPEARVRDLCRIAAERAAAIPAERAATSPAGRTGVTAVYRKIFPVERSARLAELEALHRDAAPWIGEPAPAEFAIVENALNFLVHPHDGYSTGLFLDQRDNRALVRSVSAGRRVLNAFAYTCGFSVAAAAGGAAHTASVDVSPRFLEWGKRNFAANGLSLDGHYFYCRDVLDFLDQMRRKTIRYDVIVLDPPTFGRARHSKRVFALAQDLDALVAAALHVLAPAGQLLLSTNHRGTSAMRLRRAVEQAARANDRRAQSIREPALPVDFAGDPGFAKSIWADFD